MKKILFTSIAIVLFATGCASARAASELDTKIAETKTNVQKLLEVKDDTSITKSEKEKLELQLKKSIILSILDISSSQLKDMRSQLKDVPFPESDDWKDVEAYLTAKMDEYEKFYDEYRDKVQSEDDLNLDTIKMFAKEIESKKTDEIDIFTKKITNVVTAFSISDILKLADERLEKVSADVDKIYTQKLTKKSDLKTSFEKAAKLLAEARTYNNKSKEIMLHLYVADTEAESKETSSFMTDFKKDVQQFISEQATSSTTTPLSAQKNNSKDDTVTDEAMEQYLQSIIRQSAENIRQVYDIFLNMSLSVKEFIKE